LRLEESNGKVFLADPVGSNLVTAAALKAVVEVYLAAAARMASAEATL